MAGYLQSGAEVEALLGEGSGITDWTPFLVYADLLIDGHKLNLKLPAAHLKEIARWLAAHAAECRKRDVASISQLDQSVAFPTNFYQGTNLRSTKYGARAIELDTTGTLQAVASRNTKSRIDVYSDANQELL